MLTVERLPIFQMKKIVAPIRGLWGRGHGIGAVALSWGSRAPGFYSSAHFNNMT